MQGTVNDQPGRSSVWNRITEKQTSSLAAFKRSLVWTSFCPQLKSSVGIRAFLQDLHNRLFKDTYMCCGFLLIKRFPVNSIKGEEKRA